MRACILFLVPAILATTHCAHAAAPRVLPPGKQPADARLGPLRGEEGDFSLVPAKSPEEWKKRAAEVRRVMRVALGLWPLPTKTPLSAVIHGKTDGGDYTIEKVYFQALPGFFVTGSLYRPKGLEGKRPAVLCPHGHFPGGRFQDQGRDAVRWMIAQGAERFEDEGRSFMQSRCVQLARMGCVVFHYDMIGYGDSEQLRLDWVHQYARHRHKLKQPPASGLYSAQAELYLQNVMGLHTYQSIRALDFLTGLPDVDPKRIAVTGASGGGTQTFMLCAVDDRPLVSVPVVIVSTTRQGGCTCENVCGLRIGTYNLEFTALHAPKPLLLISANDGTQTMVRRGFPDLERHYTALGVKNKVAHAAFLHFPHNYNSVSRTAMYHFVNKHLGLGLEEPILEKPYKRLTREQLTVWDDQHPRPPSGHDFERKLLQWLTDDARRQLAALTPRDRPSLQEYREVVGGAVDALLRQRLPEVSFEQKQTADRAVYRQTLGLLRYRSVENHQTELPVIQLTPQEAKPQTVLWLDGQGKSGMFTADGSLKPSVRELLKGGATVIGADVFLQGEFQPDGKPIIRARALPGEEAFAGWTYCYNQPPVVKRAHDVLALAALARTEKLRKVDVLAVNGAAPWVGLALAQCRGAFRRAAIDPGGFRFEELADVYDLNFLPGGARYGDLSGVLALVAPIDLWLAGEGKAGPPLLRAAYAAAGAAGKLTVFPGGAKDVESAATNWLLKP